MVVFPPTRIFFENYAQLFSGRLFLISDAVIVLVALIYILRSPDTSSFVRAIWHRGLWLIITAYALDFTVTLGAHFKPLFDPDSFQFGPVLGTLAIDLAIIVFLVRSNVVRDVFKSFPEPHNVPEESKKVPEPANTPEKLESLVVQRTRNIPDIDLLNQPITPGYQYADFPFRSHQTGEQILEIRVHLANGNLTLAEKGLRFLLENDKLNPALWHELALVAFSANKFDQAESMILKALLFDSRNYLYWRNLGEIRRRLGFCEDAIDNARQAIKLMPTDVNAHYNLGLALWDAGKNDEALKAFEEAKRLHPDLASSNLN